MAVKRSGGMDDVEHYSDLDWRMVSHELAFTPSGTDMTSGYTDIREHDITGGLANDELAELVLMRGFASLEAVQDTSSTNEENAGSVTGIFSLGVNADDTGEHFQQWGRQESASGLGPNGDFEALYAEYDAHNVLWGTYAQQENQWQNSTDGAGGGGDGADRYEFEIDFRTGDGIRGPFFDATDALHSLIRIGNDSNSREVQARFYAHCAYNVTEVEGVRGAYAPPGAD